MDVRDVKGREFNGGKGEGGHEADVPKGDDPQEDGDNDERCQKLWKEVLLSGEHL